VNLEDLYQYYQAKLDEGYKSWMWDLFSEWLYTTRTSADAMAEVWIATKGPK